MISFTLAIKVLAVLFSSSFGINVDIMLIPVMIEDSCSEINFKKRDSDFAGMIEVVIGTGSVPIDAVNPPIFSCPSVIETKLPLSNSNI